MKNIEKYEEEIRNAFIEQTAIGCATKKSREGNCNDESDCNTCCLKSFNWLLKEYKEPIKPILTDKEKAYLKNVIEPLNVVVDYIRKCENYTSEDNIFYTVVVRVKLSEKFDYSYVLIDFVVTEDMPFEGMELKKRYTREELGLC